MFPHLRPAVISRLFCGELRGRALLEQPRITASKGTTFNLFSPLRVYFYESISFGIVNENDDSIFQTIAVGSSLTFSAMSAGDTDCPQICPSLVGASP